jgi:hypothetical protein
MGRRKCLTELNLRSCPPESEKIRRLSWHSQIPVACLSCLVSLSSYDSAAGGNTRPGLKRADLKGSALSVFAPPGPDQAPSGPIRLAGNPNTIQSSVPSISSANQQVTRRRNFVEVPCVAPIRWHLRGVSCLSPPPPDSAAGGTPQPGFKTHAKGPERFSVRAPVIFVDRRRSIRNRGLIRKCLPAGCTSPNLWHLSDVSCLSPPPDSAAGGTPQPGFKNKAGSTNRSGPLCFCALTSDDINFYRRERICDGLACTSRILWHLCDVSCLSPPPDSAAGGTPQPGFKTKNARPHGRAFFLW